jgi:hypothetical protein
MAKPTAKRRSNLRVAVATRFPTECIMTNLVVQNTGLVELISNMLGRPYYGAGDYFQISLYQNNFQPTAISKPGDFVKADFLGYGDVFIPGEGMGAPVLFNNYVQMGAEVNPLSWTNNGVQQMIYGYYVLSLASFDLLWCEQFIGGHLLGFKETLSFDFALNLYNTV